MTDDNASSSSKGESGSPHFSFKDYQNYMSDVQSLSKDDAPTRFFNESDIHAAIVVNELVKRATQKRHPIDMFCGSFYLFRNEFKEEVDNEKSELAKNIEAEDAESFGEFKPFDDLLASIKAFFAQKLEMNVVLENEGAFDRIKSDPNWKDVFKPSMEEKRLRFFQLDSDLKNIHNHFMVSGNSFRREVSEKFRTAMCSFNRSDYASMYKSTFELLKNGSQECVLS